MMKIPNLIDTGDDKGLGVLDTPAMNTDADLIKQNSTMQRDLDVIDALRRVGWSYVAIGLVLRLPEDRVEQLDRATRAL